LELGSFWQWRIDVGSLTTIAIYPQGAILEGLNDRGHLSDESRDPRFTEEDKLIL
jgi:hypothetical protein